MRGQITRHLVAIHTYDKPRNLKVLDARRLAAIDERLASADAAVNGQPVRKQAVGAAAAAEASARVVVSNHFAAIRDDVKLTSATTEQKTAAAFGMGMDVSADLTSSLLQGSGAQLAAYEDEALRAKAADCGVTPARIDELRKARADLIHASTVQNHTAATRTGGTDDKNALLRGVPADTAYLRKIAQRVLRGQRAALAEFKSQVSRRSPEPRSAPVKIAAETGGRRKKTSPQSEPTLELERPAPVNPEALKAAPAPTELELQPVLVPQKATGKGRGKRAA